MAEPIPETITIDVSPAGTFTTSTTSTAAAGAYDAIKNQGRRKRATTIAGHADRLLPQSSRTQLIGNVSDLYRNYVLTGWIVRAHLNYTTLFRFACNTGVDSFDDEVELALVEESKADQLDVSAVHNLASWVRMAEAMAVVCGDLGCVFLDTGDTGRLQAIEADRIRNPDWQTYATDAEHWYNGVYVPGQQATQYAVHRRVGGYNSYEFERLVPAANFHLHAYRQRFDQARGISPLATAYNQLRDLYESAELHMALTKVASLFGLKIKRDGSTSTGSVDFDRDEDGNPIKKSYTVEYGRGPNIFDLNLGDDVEFMQPPDAPGINMQAFWRLTTLLSLLALDLPFALLDSSEGNFFGNKTAWLNYDRSCEEKRERVAALFDRITAFKLRHLIRRRRLTLPKGVTLARKFWQWTPRKMPWWRPLEEVTANLKAIEGALTTPQKVCAEADQGDWYDNVDQIAKAIEYATKRGVPLSWAVSPELAASVAASRGKE